MNLVIRAARPDESAELGRLAVRSKAHWGYDAEFMDASLGELVIPADQVVVRRTQVAVADDVADEGAARGSSGGGSGRLLGFGTIEGEPPAGELGMLFVDPEFIGVGVGGALFSRLTAMASELGFRRLTIAADPNAEPFYLAKGAVRIGSVPSGSLPGRTLPLLALAL